jgi:hypothetical protein
MRLFQAIVLDVWKDRRSQAETAEAALRSRLAAAASATRSCDLRRAFRSVWRSITNPLLPYRLGTAPQKQFDSPNRRAFT